MDRLDMQILELLYSNSRISYTDISRRINLSVPSVIERINKLKDEEIILKNTIEIDFEKLGKSIRAIISVDARSITYDEFYNFCKSNKNILKIFKVVGAHNTILYTFLNNTCELEKLIKEIKKYGNCSTMLVTSEYINDFKNMFDLE